MNQSNMNRDRAMSILEHLGELKRRMIRVGVVFLVFTIGAAVLYDQIFEFLSKPAEEALANAEGDIIFTQVAEAWGAAMKVAVILGFTAAMPYFLFELTLFLRAGLSPTERRYLYFFFPFAVLSFAAGVWFGFVMLIPPAINFLLEFGSELATPYPTLGSYVGLLIALSFWMGLIFELPIVMFFIAKLGVVNSSWFIKQWRWMVLFAFVLGAIVTPTFDPITQSLVAGPVIILYITGVVMARIAERGREEPENDSVVAEGSTGAGD
jgi:sec-independent protein translocase protein TatC